VPHRGGEAVHFLLGPPVRAQRRGDHRAVPASGAGLRVRHALLRREQRRLERAVRVREHEEAVEDLVVVGVGVVEGRRGPRRGQQVAERGQDGVQEREAVAGGGGGSAGAAPRPERADGAVEARERRVAQLARGPRVCYRGRRCGRLPRGQPSGLSSMPSKWRCALAPPLPSGYKSREHDRHD